MHLKKKRVGIFGGTFDPVHSGHLRVALEVAEAFELEKILIIPSFIPPHKLNSHMASPFDRLEMTCLAAEGSPVFEVSDIEIQRGGLSYTADTLSTISGLFGDDTELFFIMGMDAFMFFHTWKNYRKILAFASLAVMTRPCPELGREPSEIYKYIKRSISDEYIPSENGFGFVHHELHGIFFIKVTGLDISATRIRELAGKGRNITFLVPEKVEKYILSRGLYR